LTCIKTDTAPSAYSPAMNEQPLVDAEHERSISLAAETQFVPNGFVRRTVSRTANASVVLLGFSAGQEPTEHTLTRHAVKAAEQFSTLLTRSKPEMKAAKISEIKRAVATV